MPGSDQAIQKRYRPAPARPAFTRRDEIRQIDAQTFQYPIASADGQSARPFQYIVDMRLRNSGNASQTALRHFPVSYTGANLSQEPNLE
jgi:hypothetical protein